MAEVPPPTPASLGDFFAKRNKKKNKGSNLNVVAASKPDTKKAKAKDAEAEGWQEEEVVAATMKVEVAGKLTREEEKKEEEDNTGHAWGSIKSKPDSAAVLSDRKFPTLAKSVRTSTNINIDDGSAPTVNIATSKNVFAALDDEEDDDEQEVKRPKEIKPAMVTKKKGEMEKVAIRREVDKYVPSEDSGKKAGGKKSKADDDDDSEADDDAEEPEEVEEKERKPEVKKKSKKVEKVVEEEPEEAEEEKDEDCKIVADLEAAKAKYEGRKKPFPATSLPRSELEEEKENKPKQQPSNKKKKMAVWEEDDKPKLSYADW